MVGEATVQAQRGHSSMLGCSSEHQRGSLETRAALKRPTWQSIHLHLDKSKKHLKLLLLFCLPAQKLEAHQH